MRQINAFTQDPKQNLTVVLEDGSKAQMSLRYVTNQAGWYYDLTYGSFSVANRRLVNSPNMLRQFRGVLPFGLALTVSDGYEPIYQDDFVTGRVLVYVLSQADVLGVEALITARILV